MDAGGSLLQHPCGSGGGAAAAHGFLVLEATCHEQKSWDM